MSYVNYQLLHLKPRLHQGEYYCSNKYALLLTSTVHAEKICFHCQSSHQKFISERNVKVVVINQPAELNAPIKFKSLDEVKLILQTASDKHGETVDP